LGALGEVQQDGKQADFVACECPKQEGTPAIEVDDGPNGKGRTTCSQGADADSWLKVAGLLAELLATAPSLRENSRTLTPPDFIAAAARPTLRIELGSNGAFQAGVPVLVGPLTESFFPSAIPKGRVGELQLFEAGQWRLGAATVPLVDGLERAAHRIYDQIFQAAGELHLARIWNYVPAINEPGEAGLENYRIFCQGRSHAFEEHFGKGFIAVLPSASAVGCRAGKLTVVFAASPFRPRHIENPFQVAAYDYPPAYGPRSPSFARATVVSGPDDTTVFISGTAAIRGHATVAPHNINEQIECTLDNLREISRVCGLGTDLDRSGNAIRHFKVYLRNASDQPLVASLLEEALLKATDSVTYLHASVCRTALLVEIEATLFGVSSVRGTK